jgi:hypothetical protein
MNIQQILDYESKRDYWQLKCQSWIINNVSRTNNDLLCIAQKTKDRDILSNFVLSGKIFWIVICLYIFYKLNGANLCNFIFEFNLLFRTNNDLLSIAQKTKDRGTQTLLKIGGELRCSGRVSSSCSTRDTRRVTRHLQLSNYIIKEI